MLFGDVKNVIEQFDADAFSSSQVGSKLWLCQQLEDCLLTHTEAPPNGYRIWILAGWYGVTNLLLRARAQLKIEHVHSIDIDPRCEFIADKVNKFWEWQNWQFKAHTADANFLSYAVSHQPHVVINTSVEHFESREWFDSIPSGVWVALQGNDMVHDDHVHNYGTQEEFKAAWPLTEVYYEGTIEFNYPDRVVKRFMVIGIK